MNFLESVKVSKTVKKTKTKVRPITFCLINPRVHVQQPFQKKTFLKTINIGG